MLVCNRVSFAYPKQSPAVNEVSLTIGAGEYAAVVGRNGSGKTTLTRLIMSLIKPGQGDITFDGSSTRPYTPADMARHAGYVFQNPARQMFHDTVLAEAAYGPLQLGFSGQEATDRAGAALLRVGLAGQEKAYPAALSKGQKQCLAVASALAMEPRLLILDEPTSGQDARDKAAFMDMLEQLQQAGLAILLITHDMNLLAERVPRTIVMAGGSMVYDGATAELFQQPIVAEWGLTPPAPVYISRQLAPYGIGLATATDELVNTLKIRERGDLDG